MNAIRQCLVKSSDHLEALSYRQALLIYTAFFIIVFLPFFTGKIILPYAQLTELGVTPSGEPLKNYADIKTGNLNDIPLAFMPNIKEILAPDQAGLFNTWTNSSELGKPLPQRSYSTSWLPNWLLSTVIDDPFIYYAAHCLILTFLSGLFIFLLCKAWQLHPLACLLAALALAIWPHNVYRFGFSMHVATFCWSIAIMYAITLYARNAHSWHILLLSFSIYSLLLTGYLQEIIFLAYIVIGYGLLLTYQKYCQHGAKPAIYYLTACIAAAIIGAILSLPVYADLLYDSFNSTRTNANAAFFLTDLPKLSSGTKIFKFLGTTFHPDMFGNPLSDLYPYNSQGRSFNMILLLLLPLSFAVAKKATRGWWYAILILSALTLIPPLYQLGTILLGFNISPMSPITFMILPMAIIAALTLDQLLTTDTDNTKITEWAKRSAKYSIAILSIISLFSLIKMKEFYPLYFVISALLIYFFWRSVGKNYFSSVLFILFFATTLYSSLPMVQRQAQSLEELALHSPLSNSIASINKLTANNVGANFAVIASNPDLHPPNQQVMSPNIHVLAGLSSIHSFNSVSSHHYKTLIEGLNGKVHVSGRYNFNILPDLNSAIFYLANIGILVSDHKINSPAISFIEQQGSMFLYRVKEPMGCCVRYQTDTEENLSSLSLKDIMLSDRLSWKKTEDKTNLIRFELSNTSASAITLSQKYHKYWQASVKVEDQWLDAPTFAAGDIFQSVLIPANASELTLEFKPYIRYAWYSFVVFALWLVTLLISSSVKKRG